MNLHLGQSVSILCFTSLGEWVSKKKCKTTKTFLSFVITCCFIFYRGVLNQIIFYVLCDLKFYTWILRKSVFHNSGIPFNTVLENRPATSNSLYPIYNSNILLIIFYIEDWGDFPKNWETLNLYYLSWPYMSNL